MMPWVLPFLARGFGACWSDRARFTEANKPTLQSLNGCFQSLGFGGKSKQTKSSHVFTSHMVNSLQKIIFIT